MPPDAIKRVVDVLIGTVAIVLLVPVVALIVVAIVAEDRGGALFRQSRVGRRGQRFRIVKFRTMRRGSHHVPGPAPLWQAPDDARYTRVERFLRARISMSFRSSTTCSQVR